MRTTHRLQHLQGRMRHHKPLQTHRSTIAERLASTLMLKMMIMIKQYLKNKINTIKTAYQIIKYLCYASEGEIREIAGFKQYNKLNK